MIQSSLQKKTDCRYLSHVVSESSKDLKIYSIAMLFFFFFFFFRNDYIFDNCGLEVLQKSESCYRSYLFDKCMMATTKYLRNVNHDITFFPGEIELNSMTTQLKQKGMNDGRYKYNADGTLIVNNFSAIEILLTEVSSGYGSNETGKISFDHYKAMFGMLAMIRTVAQLYDKVSFNTFTKLKIHFLHAHG